MTSFSTLQPEKARLRHYRWHPLLAFCDIVNPVSCICGNGTRSVELRSSISDHCHNKCAWEMITLATAVLDDYCVENKAVQTQAPIKLRTGLKHVSGKGW